MVIESNLACDVQAQFRDHWIFHEKGREFRRQQGVQLLPVSIAFSQFQILFLTGMISTFPWEWRYVGEVPHIVVWVSREILRETISATDSDIPFVKD